MNIYLEDVTTPEQWITKIGAKMPYMESDDKRRAMRTIRYLKKYVAGKRGMVW